jgi:hypothetical protein
MRSEVRSLVAERLGEMTLDLHRVVQHAANPDEVGASKAIEQKMARSHDDPMLGPRTLTAIAEMIAADVLAEIGPGDTIDPSRIGRNISQSHCQKLLIAKARDLPEITFRPGKQVDNVRLCGTGNAICNHALAGRTSPLARLPAEPCDKLVEGTLCDLGIAALIDVLEPRQRRFLQSGELGRVEGIALLDQPQAIT